MSAFRQQLIDYVYGELPEAERALVEARLSQSEQERHELAELQALLHGARQVLEPDAEPPARVRAAVLAAAREAVAARPLTAAAREEPAGGVQGAVRWLQARFLIPSLAMAAAAAWLVFLRPEVSAPESGAAPREPAGARPPLAAEGERSTAEGDPLAAARREQPAATSSGAAPAAPARAEAKRQRAAAADDSAAPAATSSTAKATARRGAAAPGGFAVPPPGWGGQADRGGAAEAAAAPRAASEAQEGLGALEPAAAAPGAPLALPALVKRAREHMAAQRWAAAAADYRELLRRFPQRPEAGSWKRQLERALSAEGAR